MNKVTKLTHTSIHCANCGYPVKMGVTMEERKRLEESDKILPCAVCSPVLNAKEAALEERLEVQAKVDMLLQSLEDLRKDQERIEKEVAVANTKLAHIKQQRAVYFSLAGGGVQLN